MKKAFPFAGKACFVYQGFPGRNRMSVGEENVSAGKDGFGRYFTEYQETDLLHGQ